MISHRLLFKMPCKLGFLGQAAVMKCTDDTLSICECIVISVFKKMFMEVILCENKSPFDKFPTFLATIL